MLRCTTLSSSKSIKCPYCLVSLSFLRKFLFLVSQLYNMNFIHYHYNLWWYQLTIDSEDATWVKPLLMIDEWSDIMTDKKDMITIRIFDDLVKHIKALEAIGIENPIHHIKEILDSIRVPHDDLPHDDDHHGDNVQF